ncbi:hypothetical protein PG995_003408 [Apiospora arundinis]|uniref:Uncharacterized protein n=1 Tax=Apiospora arundinis TaxID=335852 RepID=A0ABR2HS30_9PEZI
MSYSSHAEGDHSTTGVPSRIATYTTTAEERKVEREKLSKNSQRVFLSEPTSSSNRNVMLADQTSHASVAIKKSQSEAQIKLDRIMNKLNQG